MHSGRATGLPIVGFQVGVLRGFSASGVCMGMGLHAAVCETRGRQASAEESLGNEGAEEWGERTCCVAVALTHPQAKQMAAKLAAGLGEKQLQPAQTTKLFNMLLDNTQDTTALSEEVSYGPTAAATP